MFETPSLTDATMPMTPQLAVFGHPIAHSRSPQIHTAFGHQLGIDLSYRAIDVPDGRLAPSLARFAASGSGRE